MTSIGTHSLEISASAPAKEQEKTDYLSCLPPAPLRRIVELVASTTKGARALSITCRAIRLKTTHGIDAAHIGALDDINGPNSDTKLFPLLSKTPNAILAYQARLDQLSRPSLSYRNEIASGFIYRVQQFLEKEHNVTPEDFHDIMGRDYILKRHTDVNGLTAAEAEEVKNKAMGQFDFNLDYARHIACALDLARFKKNMTLQHVRALMGVRLPTFHKVYYICSYGSRWHDVLRLFQYQEQLVKEIRSRVVSKAITLDESLSNLHALPPHIADLVHLSVLKLNFNRITQPREIGHLKSLTNLNLSVNRLSTFPIEIVRLVNLRVLDLHINKIPTLPPEIGELVNLEELDLSSNKIPTLPTEIGLLSNLRKLDVGDNELRDLPKEIRQLINLVELSAHCNKLPLFPIQIINLANLKTLLVHDNPLTSLPSEIGLLVNLTKLAIARNQIVFLPREIGQLKNLVELYMDCNPLTTLPQEIGQLENLKELCIARNEITTLPGVLTKLSALTRISLDERFENSTEKQSQTVLKYLTDKEIKCEINFVISPQFP